MISTLKPYPAYKDSSVEWLGQVPAHWEVLPLKRLAWFKSGAGFPVHHQGDTSAEIPFFKVSDMNFPGNEKYLRVCANTISMTVAQGLGATVFPAGTIVFPKVGGALLTNKRRIAANQCCIDNNMMACVARNGNRDFLFLVMSYIDLGQFAQPGPVPAIGEGEVREIRVASPSAAEQTAIVRFLDWAERRIRRVIRARKQRIKLLEEYKQALIHQAVTGQIDVRLPAPWTRQAGTGKPYPAYKDSGVEWLGQVPEHWEVKKLRFLFRYAKGSRAGELTSEYIERNPGEFPVFSGQTKHAGLMGKISWHEFDFPSPVVFVSTVGACAMTTRILSGKFSLSQNCAIIIPRSKQANPIYFEKVFQRLFVYERQSISQIMQPSLRFADLNRFYVPHPPVNEQKAIAAEIDRECSKIDAAMAADRRAIDLLQEYRTRLIADVVTGKVDVREAAARLPAEAEEVETLDEAEALPEDEAGEEDLDDDALPEEVES